MSTVVVAYDGSPSARKAVELAAGRTTAEDKLVVVHAYKVPPEWHSLSYYEDLVERTLEQASALMDRIEDDCPALRGRDWEPDIIEGRPAEVICRVARHRHADEIVLGSRGLSALAGLMGSVSHEVLHRAECPVLVIPERAVKQQPETATAGAAA
jgi:nucleotide-binding universal stress UspA family protein